MTTAATVVGRFPLVLATGPGAGARNSIGIMRVTGMVTGTFFTLFVVPGDLRARGADSGRGRRGGAPDPAARRRPATGRLIRSTGDVMAARSATAAYRVNPARSIASPRRSLTGTESAISVSGTSCADRNAFSRLRNASACPGSKSSHSTIV